MGAIGVKTDITGNVIGDFIDGLSMNSLGNYPSESPSDNGDDNSDLNNELNVTPVANATETEEFSRRKGGSGGGGGSSSSPPSEICDGIDNDGDDLIDEICGDLSCTTDANCDDGNNLTIDTCDNTIVTFNLTTNVTTYAKTCKNIIPNFYGTVYDTDGDNSIISGVNISFYDNSVYNVSNDDGNYSALVPKDEPDTVSNEDGHYGIFLAPNKNYHMVMQHSDEKEFNMKTRDNESEINQTIITETEGYIKVFFEKASAGLKSDLYSDLPTMELLVENSQVGKVSYLNDSYVYPAGTELKFHILVHGTGWGLGEYNHSSNSQYAQIERLDKDTWRIHFEDLPESWPPDWDFNDAVVLIDVVGTNITNETIYDNDCDEDGIVNWLDDDDDSCDHGEEDQEMDEDDHGNFNAEGHILFHGQYGRGNKYICGDKLKFMMFGINKRASNETITFMVEDHTAGGGNKGDWVYNGSISNTSESLLVVNNGTRQYNEFEFSIPCDFNEGKHDIHILWDDEKFHKIGNFFVIADTTPPYIYAEDATGLPGIEIEIGYDSNDPAEPGTVRALELDTLEGAEESLSVVIDKDIDSDGTDLDGNTTNDADYSVSGGTTISVNLTYDNSGNYTARFTTTDGSGNTAFNDSNIIVYINESEADDIAVSVYDWFGLSIGLQKNYFVAGLGDAGVTVDRYNILKTIGDEYITPGNGVTNSEASVMNSNIDLCTATPFVKAISATTAVSYNNTLVNFLTSLKCDCNVTMVGSPSVC